MKILQQMCMMTSLTYDLFTALEGYLLYRALVVVFDTGDHRNFPLYIFGYGLPIVLTTVTFIVALLASENNKVCWKNVLACLIIELGPSLVS